MVVTGIEDIANVGEIIDKPGPRQCLPDITENVRGMNP
jgi:hypothetical protein